MNNTTLKEIASQLGISITTVSKALKGYSDVNEKTKKAVIELANQLNYKPNSFAVNLRTKESKTIGLIIPTIVHHFFSNVIKGILEEAEKRDYMVIILQSNEKVELEKKQINLLLNKRVDGILISLSNETDDFKHLNSILFNNTPLVLFDKIAKIVNCSKVMINDRKAAYDAVCYLIKKGYKKIAHFRGSYLPQNSIDRFLGYKKALEDNNIPYDPALVFVCENNDDFKDGYENAKKIITEQLNFDAIFAVTDLVAIGTIQYLNETGISIPKQVAVLGFSNWFMSSVISPALSTIDQPGFEMGKKSAAILFDEINLKKNNLPVTFQTIELETKLIERKTT
ncbi:transcriptional regulator, LacI family [Flavobacterium glycines]|uniref:LacI family transcriptional regulator n=1 Tax=Flavobacterium glycines TaxID=551990 RepID=A0A1B9DRZ4_9FLAO|nr:LacI family DNA-binding transcriptional regulator [Flavobacterium glycines]OCB72457.1 LacI family transcriptional regulator [Flavobacterium glycines]GEL09946.1 LacI family transcriptional regulator [Flavobacterium glycines]SDI87519.1 transcriptional regulator, LacI family [Flavobacterium glycines]